MELIKQRTEKLTEIFNKNNVFFAFNDKQFQESKTKLQEGEKYVRIGSGGYIPKCSLAQYITDMEALTNWFDTQVLEKETRYKYIAYELSNHEAYYTYDISDTLEALGDSFTREEVLNVFHIEKLKHLED